MARIRAGALSRVSARIATVLAWSCFLAGGRSGAQLRFPIHLWTQSIAAPATVDDALRGELLSSEWVPSPPNTVRFDLVFRSTSTGGVLGRLSPQDWSSFWRAHERVSCGGQFDSLFRIVEHGSLILGLECPWLAVYNSRDGTLIRRELPDPDLLDTTVPSRTAPYPPRPAALAVDSARERIAVAYNVGSFPRIFLYSADLRTELHCWPLRRYVQDVSWSRDGRHLAILYSGLYDPNRHFVGWGRTISSDPNIEIIDVDTGTVAARAFSGNPTEGQVLFAPDATLVYTIAATSLSDTEPQGDGVRAIDWKTGRLVRVFEHLGFPLHAELAISSDGRWLAADASTDLKHLPFVEADPFGDHSRVVAVDTITGKTIPVTSKETSVARDPTLLFADDSNISFVVVGPGRAHRERIEKKDEISAYCMDSTCAKIVK